MKSEGREKGRERGRERGREGERKGGRGGKGEVYLVQQVQVLPLL